MNSYPKERRTGEALLKQIIDLIRRGTVHMKDICWETGYATSAIHERLCELKEARRVHSRPELAGRKRQLVWFVGPDPDIDEDFDTDPPVRQVVTVYPAIARRDPLVAALFGAPKQSAHRCVGCGSTERHIVGCMFLGAA